MRLVRGLWGLVWFPGVVAMVRRASSAGLGAVLRSRFQGPAAPWAGSERGFRGRILRLQGSTNSSVRIC